MKHEYRISLLNTNDTIWLVIYKNNEQVALYEKPGVQSVKDALDYALASISLEETKKQNI